MHETPASQLIRTTKRTIFTRRCKLVASSNIDDIIFNVFDVGSVLTTDNRVMGTVHGFDK